MRVNPAGAVTRDKRELARSGRVIETNRARARGARPGAENSIPSAPRGAHGEPEGFSRTHLPGD